MKIPLFTFILGWIVTGNIVCMNTFVIIKKDDPAIEKIASQLPYNHENLHVQLIRNPENFDAILFKRPIDATDDCTSFLVITAEGPTALLIKHKDTSFAALESLGLRESQLQKWEI